jgi:hypothetical protein
MHARAIRWVTFFCWFVSVLVCVDAGAQTRRGRLLVTVTDSTGAVIPNADVRIAGIDNATRSATIAPAKTAATGVGTFEGLATGRYSVVAEFAGFETGVIKSVNVRAGDNRQTIVLSLRGLTDTVTVGRDAQEAASDRGVTFGTALTREQIDALSEDPNELRQQLLDMAGPGAVISVDSFEGGQLPPRSQIRSIRIARDQFAAENHSAGIGRIEIITQPGIGPIRGGVNTTFFDSALDGRNPLVQQTGPAQNKSFGANVSGTLIAEKLSFGMSLSSGSGYTTPVLRTATPDGIVSRNAELRTPSNNTSFYAQADYALTRDQTIRFNVNRFTARFRNQGVGVYDEIERAFSTENGNNSVYVQQTGPLGRRFALNSRLSVNWSDMSTEAAIELPTVIINEARTTGGAQRTGSTATRMASLASDLDYVRGIHSVRVGVQAEMYRYNSDSNSNYLGTYTFESLEAFQAGRPRSYTRRIGDPNIRYSNTQVGVYLQDDIRVRRSLTLSPGVRYEVQALVPDKVNIAPRFGFTWSPFAGGRTTFRSSVGVFYDWLPTGIYQQTLQVDGFRQQEINLINPSYPDPGEIGAAAPTNRYLLSPDMNLPRTIRTSFGVAHTFNQMFSVGAIYADARGSSLLVGRNLNAPVEGLRPDPAFANIIEALDEGRSTLRTLNTNLQINLAAPGFAPAGGPLFDWRRGLRIGVNHTYGTMRNDTDGAFSTPATGSLDDEWGPAAGDVRHRGGINISTGVLRNLNATIQITGSSAPPLTIRTGLDDNGDLIFNDRPEGVGRNSARTSGQWNSFALFSYSIPLGTRSFTAPGGISITSQGGGLVVNQAGMQSVARYRLVLGLNIQNITNRANYVGYSGVMTSPLFLQPTSAQGVRRVTFAAALTF